MMTGKIAILTLVAALVGMGAIAFADTWENWNDMNCSIKLNPGTSFDIYNRTKFREAPFTETYLTGIQAGLSRKFIKNLNILFAYRYEINNKKRYYEFENRFLLQYTYKISLKHQFSLQLAQRTETRYFTRQTADNVRFRANLNISKKMKIRRLNFAPYLAGELFYDTNAHQINRERIYLGTLYNINSRYAIRLGWIGQKDTGKDLLDILNTGVNFAL
jgi:hypothetical protein